MDDTDLPAAIAAPAHGGTLAAVSLAYPNAPRPWIDLSTGINPYAWPHPDKLPAIPDSALTRLPEPTAITDLEGIAARTYGAGAGTTVVATPGTQIIISLLPRLLPARTVAIVGPTYSEHAIAWKGAGHKTQTVPDLDTAANAEVVVVVNPNNPDGRITSVDLLVDMANDLARRDGLLVVDEAFADLEDRAVSTIPTLPPDGMLVMRSFGKTYGLAGVRLGFAVTGDALAERIRQALGPWAVAGPALFYGAKALVDSEWRTAMARRLEDEIGRLDRTLYRAGCPLVGGTRLFRLVQSPNAAGVFHRLAQNGIVARRFGDRPTLLRFGLPGSDEAWGRLESALISSE